MCYLNASYCCTHHFDSHYQPASFVWDGASVSTEEDEKHLLNLLEKKKTVSCCSINLPRSRNSDAQCYLF